MIFEKKGITYHCHSNKLTWIMFHTTPFLQQRIMTYSFFNTLWENRNIWIGWYEPHSNRLYNLKFIYFNQNFSWVKYIRKKVYTIVWNYWFICTPDFTDFPVEIIVSNKIFPRDTPPPLCGGSIWRGSMHSRNAY